MTPIEYLTSHAPRWVRDMDLYTECGDAAAVTQALEQGLIERRDRARGQGFEFRITQPKPVASAKGPVTRTTIAAWVTMDERRKVRAAALAQGCTVSQLLRMALQAAEVL